MNFDTFIGFLLGILFIVTILLLLPIWLSLSILKKIDIKFIKHIYYYWINK